MMKHIGVLIGLYQGKSSPKSHPNTIFKVLKLSFEARLIIHENKLCCEPTLCKGHIIIHYTLLFN